MKAKEMFEELGYEVKYGNIAYDVLCKIYIDEENWIQVEFSYKSYRLFQCSNGNFLNKSINIELHKAIHQQMIELGWLDE